MVLRLLIFIFLVTASSASGESRLSYLYKVGDYEALLDEIDDDVEANEFKALALEGMGDLIGAEKVYRKILKESYRDELRLVFKSHKKKTNVEFEFENQEKFQLYLHKLASLNVLMYEQLNRGDLPKKIKRQRSKAATYVSLLEKVDDESESPDILKGRITDKDKLLASFVYHQNYYAFLSFVSFQDYLVVKKTDGSSKSKVLNTTSGSCSGGGIRFMNEYYEWNVESCFLLGKSTVETQEGDLSYKQNSVPVSGLFGGVGFMSHSLAEDLSLGGQINYLWRSGDWQQPSGTVVEDTSYLRFGYTLRTSWQVRDFAFSMSIGKIFQNPSSFIKLATQYHF